MRMAAERFVRLMGLEVVDTERYRAYRAGMTPILVRYGGGFGYDLVVSEVLKSESTKPINRVFTIFFPSRDAAERFFADPEYLRVRKELFEPSVKAVTMLASFVEPVP
jgi:uncharacterized protein (DUF1330 family)